MSNFFTGKKRRNNRDVVLAMNVVNVMDRAFKEQGNFKQNIIQKENNKKKVTSELRGGACKKRSL